VSRCDALVVGAGITGITTALALQTIGLKPAILAQRIPLQAPGENAVPCVPTGYAMASAYPHNLRVDNLHDISAVSQVVLKALCETSGSGVELYRMYEVFEEEPESPPVLGGARMKLQEFCGKPEHLRRTIDPPTRAEADYLWGWVFETYFADMPKYLPFLWRLFRDNGGMVEEVVLDLETVLKLAGERPIFNCLGLGAVAFLNDEAPHVVMRGKQVLVPGAPKLKAADGMCVAYNYTPPASVFARSDGKPEYAHFFARSDGWILGQTREPGRLDSEGNWRGAAVDAAAQYQISDCLIPAPILDLNQAILSRWLDCTLPPSADLIGREGYRYYRDPEGEGVRLSYQNIDGHAMFHNYGHGGSGVTMSWGCAMACVQEYLRLTEDDGRQHPMKTKLIKHLLGNPSEV
jgi:D-amino-acid oxidase